jgi:hypothetical protein
VWTEQLEGKRFATYDARRGTIRKYLYGLARNHVLRWLQSRALRTSCEREAMRRKSEKWSDSDGALALMLADFLEQASPGESAYIHQELLRDWPPSEANPLSDVNKRQLHHRAARRLLVASSAGPGRTRVRPHWSSCVSSLA